MISRSIPQSLCRIEPGRDYRKHGALLLVAAVWLLSAPASDAAGDFAWSYDPFSSPLFSAGDPHAAGDDTSLAGAGLAMIGSGDGDGWTGQTVDYAQVQIPVPARHHDVGGIAPADVPAVAVAELPEDMLDGLSPAMVGADYVRAESGDVAATPVVQVSEFEGNAGSFFQVYLKGDPSAAGSLRPAVARAADVNNATMQRPVLKQAVPSAPTLIQATVDVPQMPHRAMDGAQTMMTSRATRVERLEITNRMLRNVR